MRSRSRVLLTLIGVAALVAGATTPAVADTSDFEFSLFDADYALSQAADGTSVVQVTETIVAEFPDYDQNRGIVRALPRWYQRAALNPTVTSVVDENGAPVFYEEVPGDEFLVLNLGTDDYVYGSNTYVISYSMQNVVGTFADQGDDEFYWDVNGTGFAQPFDRVSSTVRVDPALTGTLTGETACFRGSQGETTGCALTSATDATGATLFTADETGLGAEQTLTVVVGFTEGTFVQGAKTQPVPRVPSVDTPAPWWSNLLSGITGVGALALLVGAIVSRVRRGNGARGRGTIIPQYSAPKNVNVMVAAHLVDRGATAIPAQLVSLAVRKNLRILDYPVTTGDAEYTLQYITSDGADDLERSLLVAVFGTDPEPGAVRELTPGDESLGSSVLAVSDAARAAVVTSGLRLPLTLGGIAFAVLAVFAFAVAVVNQIATIGAYSLAPWPLASILLSIVAAVVAALLVQRKGHLTPLGAEARDYLLGMQVYLKLAEQERFRMLQSPDGAERVDVGDTKQVVKLYEKLLPFAVIWGVEDEWSKELEIRAAEADVQPDWFVSNNGFTALALTSALRGSSGAISYTAPTWESGGATGSSFGSGFGGTGGGGFSGGGGGGGGGGGR
ncbi:hypothetical protein GCM10027413_19310 [Conyzicola nivalis]|uniref:DUF2207 domain-containing protein n=1 Tax=Conyzicola nivalis TaxID=1477021 RepID=A0A916SGQ4_9MICO|nr:DUF2207 domain-containing protein [Conyzicola nivalis]GGA95441.1 hypothetical protein GCM10010979_07310 [Conyzicola nivalis]